MKPRRRSLALPCPESHVPLSAQVPQRAEFTGTPGTHCVAPSAFLLEDCSFCVLRPFSLSAFLMAISRIFLGIYCKDFFPLLLSSKSLTINVLAFM